MKRFFINITLLIIISLSLQSCNSGNGSSDSKLIYWCSNNSYEIQFAKELTEKWNKNNKDVSVKYQPVPEGRSSEEIILAAVVGKTTPDIYSNMWQGDVEVYAQAGVLIALDTIPGFLEFLAERCDSEVVEEIKSLDGHIYQIPWKINPIMLIYNEKMISNLGLSNPPKTYAEFFEASAKFQKDIDGDGYIDRWFGYSEVLVTWWQRFFDFYPLYLAASDGAPLVKENKAVFNNEYGVAVFKFLRTLYKKNYFSKEQLSARQDVFLSEIIATRFTGPWEIAHADKFKPKGFEYNFSCIPVPDDHKGPVYTYGDPKNIVIFKTCKKPQAAWEYVKTLIDRDGDLKLLQLTNQLPRRKNISTISFFSSYFEQNPKMKIFANQSKYVRGTDASPVLKEVFDLISQEYEACVIYGMKTPEQAVKDASDAVDLLFLK
ncbi:MAG: ABC transporter substrate-binding protein [Ignavibacteria bacterium CG2_30_36_16]|nr:MAG: ABC transporter substrate-binding protein [Ignavibacteria bacterium CG2_30_36_16]PJB00803.1 MAG: ABC transporter substrate-binding protein [Ignavibacteria bacterium CG_4_9_14_3_um_filter_36_18]